MRFFLSFFILLDEARRIRLVLYAGNSTSAIGHVDVTLRDLCEIDPSQEAFQIETTYHNDEVGSLSLLRAEPTDVGSFFILKINHASSAKYIANNDDGKRKSQAKAIKRVLSKKFTK